MAILSSIQHPLSRSSSSSNRSQIRHVWIALIALVGALSTFIIYDKMFHSVEISHLMVVSIDNVNVGVSQQQRQQQQPYHQQLAGNWDEKKKQKELLKQKLRQQQRLETTTSPIHQEQKALEVPVQSDAAALQKVFFLNQTQVTNKDSFSASWLQSKADFLQMDLTKVKICEDAAFKAWNTRKDKLRMPLDYFDFSVEHLSKWWKLLDYHEHDIVFESVRSKLEAYVDRGADAEYASVGQDPVVLGNTLATIAFQPYNPPKAFAEQQAPRERSYNLTVVSLAATIESLRRAEMGRVVVLGSQDDHVKYVQGAFDYLAEHLPHLAPRDGEDNSSNVSKIGHMELAFVTLLPEQLRTKFQAKNMPYGALSGSREAFLLADAAPASRTEEQKLYLQQWLGTTRDPTFWQYLYLTEPDSILTTRPSALPQIKEEIDVRGGIVAPFRLQPIPHESDIPGYLQADRFLPDDGHWPVLELDHTNNNAEDDGHHNAVCCDEHMGHDHRPGKSQFEECGRKKWFLCGFEQKVPTEDPHERLRPYKLFRLTKGTGLTMIAGNVFARRCMPANNAVCKPPHLQ